MRDSKVTSPVLFPPANSAIDGQKDRQTEREKEKEGEERERVKDTQETMTDMKQQGAEIYIYFILIANLKSLEKIFQ